jgi:hypothetical protein
MTIHAVVRDEEIRAFFDLAAIPAEGIRELRESAVVRDAGLDVLGMWDERGLLVIGGWLLVAGRGLLRLRGTPNDLGLAGLGPVDAARTSRCHRR